MNRLRVFWTFVLIELAMLTGLHSARTLPPPRSPLDRPIRTVAPVALPDVRFTDLRGRAVRLSDLRGRVTLLAFSNVRCVEESACMHPLPHYRAVAAALGDRARDAAFVFVGVDAAQDGPQLAGFIGDANALGWTAPASELRPLTLRMGVHMNKSDGVLLAHAPFIYLLDRSTNLRVYVPKAARAEELIAEVQALLTAR